MTFKNEDKLCPPAYKPTDLEIKLAKIKLIFEDEIYGMIEDLTKYVELKEENKVPSYLSEQKIVNDAKYAASNWREILSNWENEEWWDAFDPKGHYNYIVRGLNSLHIGDCTGHPATCVRCLSEEYFNVPFTAKWSKAEGRKMLDEFIKDKELKEK